MNNKIILIGLLIILQLNLFSQIGTRFPSEKKIVPDPVSGIQLTFLTSKPNGDSKIYQTHPQWTSDGKWIIFRSNRVRGEAADHPHPTFSPDGTRIEIQSAMLSDDNRTMNICIIPVPAPLLNRKYDALFK